MVTMELPEPLVSPEVDLRDYRWMKLDIGRLLNSDFNAMVDDTAWRCGVTLWMRAWHQVPAGSLPDDDALLCHHAGLGRDLKTWKRIKDLSLHGFLKCSDGRLYHPVIAELVGEAWEMKLAFQEKQEQERRRKAAWREAKKSGVSHGTDQQSHTGQDEMSHGTYDESDADVPCQNALRQDRDRDRTNILLESPPSSPPSPEEPTAPVSPSPDEQGSDRSKRGTRLPGTWEPTTADKDFAVGLKLDASATAERFRDYWIAQPGTKGVKLDWDATWRNWCRTEAERGPRPAAKASSLGPTLQGEAEWDLKVRLFDPEKPWSWGAMSGPRPDQPGCYAPAPVLVKYGWRNAAHERGDSA